MGSRSESEVGLLAMWAAEKRKPVFDKKGTDKEVKSQNACLFPDSFINFKEYYSV